MQMLQGNTMSLMYNVIVVALLVVGVEASFFHGDDEAVVHFNGESSSSTVIQTPGSHHPRPPIEDNAAAEK
jgi:hypothetical protein